MQVISLIISILSFLGVGTFLGLIIKDKYEERKKEKNHIKELKEKEIHDNLMKDIKAELEPITKDINDIKNDLTYIRQDLDPIFNKYLNYLYEQAKLTKDELVMSLFLVAAKEKLNKKGYEGLNSKYKDIEDLYINNKDKSLCTSAARKVKK